MTENEAINVLEKPSKHIHMVHKTKNEMEFYTFSYDLVKAFEKAIKALEEIQQYRAIGTVEEFKALKDAEEQGLLHKLPAAIGSDVFFIPSKVDFDLNVLHHHEEFNRVYHQKIARLHFYENGWYAEGELNLRYGLVDRLFLDESYKETWFLSQEEAEQALAEMERGAE